MSYHRRPGNRIPATNRHDSGAAAGRAVRPANAPGKINNAC